MEKDAADCLIDEPHDSDAVAEGSQALASACESDLTKAGKGVASESDVSDGELQAPTLADISDAMNQLVSSTAAEEPELKELVVSAVPADVSLPCESEQKEKEPTEESIPEIQSTACRESNHAVVACELEGEPLVVSQIEANCTTESDKETDVVPLHVETVPPALEKTENLDISAIWPASSPGEAKVADHRDRRYYSSPDKCSALDSPEKGSTTPRSSRRRTRWQDAEPNTVAEPPAVPLFDCPVLPAEHVKSVATTFTEPPEHDKASSKVPEYQHVASATPHRRLRLHH
ncbi:hypothetical protein MRX96_004451 [Rhipicephalus microplus]